MIKRKCYFFNVGTVFDKNNLKYLEDVWNCNPHCCKSDLCNGLYCENYGIIFDKENAIKEIKDYVKDGVVDTYGYIKSVDVELPEDVWKSIYDNLVEDYDFESIKEAKTKGYISFDFPDLIDDFSSYWEEPDTSFLKVDRNKIVENEIHILKEQDLDSEVIKWVNENLYSSSKDASNEI